jgi:hypothetical protein
MKHPLSMQLTGSGFIQRPPQLKSTPMLARLFILFLVSLGFSHGALADYPITGGLDSCDAAVLKTVGDHSIRGAQQCALKK